MIGDKKLDHVNYDSLDRAKNAFIAAGKKTASFARKFGFIPDDKFGASANVFSLDLKPFLQNGAESLHITLVPEGLGTADDARPDDLTDAELTEFWRNIAYKSLATMTNDAASSGMQPVLVSMYMPSSTPETVFNEPFLNGFLDGFVEGCKKIGCVYFSGETPQLKSKIFENVLDIAGAVFGIVPPGQQAVDSGNLKAGDSIVFIESSGPQENGYTSLRKLAAELPDGYHTKLPSGQEYWQALNKASILYSPLVQAVLAAGILPGNIEPITGHGWQKLMRPKIHLRYVIEEMLPVTEIFEFVQEKTNTPASEMIKIFNYGVGMAIFTRTRSEAEKIVAIAKKFGLNAIVAGKTEAANTREVLVKPLNTLLNSESFLLSK